MSKHKMDGPNPSNPFLDDEGMEIMPGIIQYPWGTISVPRGAGVPGELDEFRRLHDSFNGGKKGS